MIVGEVEAARLELGVVVRDGAGDTVSIGRCAGPCRSLENLSVDLVKEVYLQFNFPLGRHAYKLLPKLD